MKLSQKAQSVIEFTTVIVLVLVGIILMRPYMIRSINAHFKLWEDSVEDSLEDPLREAPIEYDPSCGDGICEGDETFETCCHDCGECGDTFCCPDTETLDTCCADCGGGVCGDGTCCDSDAGGDETPDNCCQDCEVNCGNQMCCVSRLQPDESRIVMLVPTGEILGDDEYAGQPCDVDCPPCHSCGDGDCDEDGEDRENDRENNPACYCCRDCSGLCGDGFCCSDAIEGVDPGFESDDDMNYDYFCCSDCGWCPDGVCCSGSGENDPDEPGTYCEDDCPPLDMGGCRNYTCDCNPDAIWPDPTGTCFPYFEQPGPTIDCEPTQYNPEVFCCSDYPGEFEYECPNDPPYWHAGECYFYNPPFGECGDAPCFLAGTLITMADGSTKPIEDIEVDDRVLSYDKQTQEFKFGTVTKLYHHPNNSEGEYLIINRHLRVTPNHRFAVGDGEHAQIGMLKEGDVLINEQGEKETIRTIERYTGDMPVFNFSVEPFHTYIAEGFVALNRPKGSSLRYKKDVKDLDTKTDKIFQLRPVEFTWKKTEKEDVGLIAEEVAEIIPELTIYDQQGRPNGIQYDKVNIYLLKAIKELKEESEKLKQRIEKLETDPSDADIAGGVVVQE